MTRFRCMALLAVAAAVGLWLWGCAESGLLMPRCGDGNQDPGEQCDDGNNDGEDGCSAFCTTEVVTGIQPTLASIQQNVFDQVCANCHYTIGGSLPYLESQEASYASLVNVQGFLCASSSGGWALLVKPYDPEDSCLVMVIVGANGAGGFFMPPTPIRPLEAEQIAAIREWITRGAAP